MAKQNTAQQAKPATSALAAPENRETETETALATADTKSAAVSIAELSDRAQMEQLQLMLDCEPAEIEAIATGRLPFWPAIPGLMLHGVVAGHRDIPTAYGLARLYTLTLKKPAAAQTLDGEIFELPAGEQISVLERTVLRELETREGQEVGILNAGKKAGKKFSYWDYKIVGVRRTAEQVQAAAQMAMARMQSAQLRQLPSSAAKE